MWSNIASVESYEQIHGALGLRDEASKAGVGQVRKDFVSPVKKWNFSL